MATTDNEICVHRPLAERAWVLRERYNLNKGMTKRNFMAWYDLGEIQLSTVYENLFVETRNLLGKPTAKESADGYDFVKVFPTQRRVLGDMKIGTLQRSNDNHRFQIGNVHNKIGNIYIVAWNWITESVCYFAIPPDNFGEHPKAGYKIPVHPVTGERTGGWYNNNCAFDSWEEMVQFG